MKRDDKIRIYMLCTVITGSWLAFYTLILAVDWFLFGGNVPETLSLGVYLTLVMAFFGFWTMADSHLPHKDVPF